MPPIRILIYIPVGDNCEALKWIQSISEIEDFSISVFLVHYGSDLDFPKKFAKHNIRVISDNSPSKFEKFFKHVKNNEITLEDFDLFWIADDDIRISRLDFINFIDRFQNYNLEIAQPGCLGFAMGNQIVRRDLRYDIRFSNYVDGMAPLFSRYALSLCLPTFQGCESGRGIDHVWAALLKNPKKRIGIIDSSLMFHLNPSGAKYSRFQNPIELQYQKIKDRYIEIVNQYYPWEQKVVHGSVPRRNSLQVLKGVYPLINKTSEIQGVGLRRILKYLRAKFAQ